MGPRGTSERDVPSAEGVAGWFAGRLPDEWFDGPPEVVVDREEVLVVGTLPAPYTDDEDPQYSYVSAKVQDDRTGKQRQFGIEPLVEPLGDEPLQHAGDRRTRDQKCNEGGEQ